MALTELPSFDNTDRENELAQRLQVGSTATESIDLHNIFGEGLTTSGSFNAAGIKSTSFCKLLRAIPIPALLVDKSHTIIFCNDACARISRNYEKLEGTDYRTNQAPSVSIPNSMVGSRSRTDLDRVITRFARVDFPVARCSRIGYGLCARGERRDRTEKASRRIAAPSHV